MELIEPVRRPAPAGEQPDLRGSAPGRRLRPGDQDIAQKGDTVRFTLKDFDVKQIARLSGLAPFQAGIRFAPDKNNVPVLTLKLKAKEDPLACPGGC